MKGVEVHAAPGWPINVQLLIYESYFPNALWRIHLGN
jgi:hypothetical protein